MDAKSIPRFLSRFRCEVVQQQGIFLISESETILLRGKIYIQLAPLIDGSRTVEQIALAMHNTLSAAVIIRALERLHDSGYIELSSSRLPPEQRAFWEHFNTDARHAEQKLRHRACALFTFGDVDAELLRLLLMSLGVRVVTATFDSRGESIASTRIADKRWRRRISRLIQQQEARRFERQIERDEDQYRVATVVAKTERHEVNRRTAVQGRSIDTPQRSATPSGAMLAHELRALRQRRDTAWAPLSNGSESLLDHTSNHATDIANDEPFLWIAITDDYLRSGLDELNQAALAQGRPWLILKPRGIQWWLGPIFVPGVTGCWSCLSNRLRGHRKIDDFLSAMLHKPLPFPPPSATVAAWEHAATAMAATEVAKWLVKAEVDEKGKIDWSGASLRGRVTTIHADTLAKREHVLVRRPQCPTCGKPERSIDALPRKPQLEVEQKRFTADGGHRSRPPEETWHRLKHHISPITGIISALRADPDLANGPPGVPVYATDHNFVHMNDSLYFLRETLRARSGGKGKSRLQAKTSALCESIERYSGVFQGNEARRIATMAQLGDAAIHPNDCMLFSERQYRERSHWQSRRSRFNYVPMPFDAAQAIEWTPLWSMARDEIRYLPTAYCYYGYRSPPGMEQANFARADSNGCAAGNSLGEAVLQGFFELVERDAVALWWYNRLRRPAVYVESFPDADIAGIFAYYRDLHRDLHVLDITSDFGIPTFAAVSRVTNRVTEDIILGFGTHFDPEIALLRALTEINQSLPFVLGGIPDAEKEHSGHDIEAIEWWETATYANQNYLVPHEDMPARKRCDYENCSSNDISVDVHRCVQLCAQRGLDMLVLDQTRADTGLTVAKVVVPGLRHFWARFAAGRLYDIPVMMGWLKSPTAEESLNPRYVYF